MPTEILARKQLADSSVTMLQQPGHVISMGFVGRVAGDDDSFDCASSRCDGDHTGCPLGSPSSSVASFDSISSASTIKADDRIEADCRESAAPASFSSDEVSTVADSSDTSASVEGADRAKYDSPKAPELDPMQPLRRTRSILKSTKSESRTSSTNSVDFHGMALVYHYEEEEADYDFVPGKPTILNINGQTVIFTEPQQQAPTSAPFAGAPPPAQPSPHSMGTYSSPMKPHATQMQHHHSSPPQAVSGPCGQQLQAGQHSMGQAQQRYAQSPDYSQQAAQYARMQHYQMHYQQQQFAGYGMMVGGHMVGGAQLFTH